MLVAGDGSRLNVTSDSLHGLALSRSHVEKS